MISKPRVAKACLHVFMTELEKVAFEKRESLLKILADDPRPAYQENPARVYGFRFASYEIKFRVECGKLFVLSVEERNG